MKKPSKPAGAATCVAPLTDDDSDDAPLCGAPATTTRLSEGLVCPLCEEHARELDAARAEEQRQKLN